jgi:hypothetical protein
VRRRAATTTRRRESAAPRPSTATSRRALPATGRRLSGPPTASTAATWSAFCLRPGPRHRCLASLTTTRSRCASVTVRRDALSTSEATAPSTFSSMPCMTRWIWNSTGTRSGTTPSSLRFCAPARPSSLATPAASSRSRRRSCRCSRTSSSGSSPASSGIGAGMTRWSVWCMICATWARMRRRPRVAGPRSRGSSCR